MNSEKSTTQNISDRQLDKKSRFCLQEGEGREKEENAFVVLKERKKEGKDKKRILSTCRMTGTQKKQNIKFWYPQFLNQEPSPDVCAWEKVIRISQILFIPRKVL